MKIYILTLILLLIPACYIGYSLSSESSAAIFGHIAWFIIPYSIVLIPLVFYTLFSLFGRLVSHFWAAGRYVEYAAIGIGCVVCVMLIIGHFWGSKHLVVREVTVESDRIPAGFDGYRIVQLSDIHLASQRTQPEFMTEIVDKVNTMNADMVCVTGDLVTIDYREIQDTNNPDNPNFAKDLKRIKAKDGVFSILGNHDYHQYSHLPEAAVKKNLEIFKQKQRDLGWRLLLNESEIIRHNGDSLCLGGCENDGDGKHFPQYGDLPKTFQGMDSIPCKILLSHDPTHWRRTVLKEPAERDVILMLAGHTHATQFMVCGWAPSKHIYSEWYGLYEENNHFLNVSSGIGGAGLPFRFGAWPEICVITLKHKDK